MVVGPTCFSLEFSRRVERRFTDRTGRLGSRSGGGKGIVVEGEDRVWCLHTGRV